MNNTCVCVSVCVYLACGLLEESQSPEADQQLGAAVECEARGPNHSLCWSVALEK